ncbi:RHS repeat-associated core domain-containing protein [Burkholderia stagnalis]|uniref:RHS repeat-associated core domain-containing protein n=1 Tax=Burkholderia stagnalis TaxID=1503054 RepID=UPI001F499292|nr:RHS repeat-associated core domain-containing protein [Burkholderia stagnalis]
MGLLAVKHLDPVVGVDVHSVLVAPSPTPVFLPHPHVGFMLDLREYIEAAKGVVGSIAMAIAQEKAAEYLDAHPDVAKKLDDAAGLAAGKLADLNDNPIVADALKLQKAATTLEGEMGDALGSGVGTGGSAGRPIFVNGLLRATAGTHSFHVPGLHFPLGEAFAPPPPEDPLPSDDAESYMGSRTVLANNDPMSFMALPAMSCWSVGLEPPPHNGAHTERSYPSMPSSVMLPIPAGRPVLVGGPPVMNMAAAAKGLFKAFQGSKWAKALADKLGLKPGFLRCKVLKAEPVDVTTGEVVVQHNDFTVSGRLPLVWDRDYASNDYRMGAVGFGWQTPADIRLALMSNEGGIGAVAHFPDHATAFDTLPQDDGWPARTYDWQHGDALYRHDGRLVIRTRHAIEYEFALPPRWQAAVAAVDGDSRLTLPIERMADLNGNAWVFERNADGSLVRLVEWKRDAQTERVIECGVGHGRHAGLLMSLMLIDASGNAHRLASYEYDSECNLMASIDGMAHPHHFEYVAGHRMVRHTSARGVSFYYSYQQDSDGAWRADRAWGDKGLLDYRFFYDRARMETRVTNSLGHTTITQMNERGMPVAEIDPSGGVTGYRYDAHGRTSAVIDPAGRTTTWEYDEHGNLLAQTLPDDSAVRIEYDDDHRPVCVTAPASRQWRYEWDRHGNLITQTTPLLAISRYAYDVHGQLVSHTGPRGAVTQFEYDRNGNPAVRVDALGNRTQYAYDVRGNVVRIVDALGQASCFDYDGNGNLIRSIEPGGHEARCTYDHDDNLVRYHDPAGHTTTLEYSPLGQVSKRIAADGTVVEYLYNTEEQLVGVINERGERYALRRDGLGRIVEEIDYRGQPRRYEYGASGELRRSIDPLGRAIEYRCDAMGRIVQKRVPDPRQPDGWRVERFAYDPGGELVRVENPDCRVELRYDAEGRIVEERQGDDFTIAFAYDASGNRIERHTRLSASEQEVAHVVRYGYDKLDAVTSIQIDDAMPISLERDAIGQISVERLNAEQWRESTYDTDGRPARQMLLGSTGVLFTSEYAYDASGELIEKRDSRIGIDRFEYDPVGRVTRHIDPAGNVHRFLHDRTGDLLKTQVRRSSETDELRVEQSGDAWEHEGEYDGSRYVFDRAGNLVRKSNAEQDLRLSWDGDGLLIETVATRRTAEGVSHIHARYTYDALHRRVGKFTQIRIDGSPGTNAGAVSSVRSRASRFFWDGEVLTREVSCREYDAARPDDREWIYYVGTFRPLAAVHHASGAGDIYFFHNDPNGAPVRVTDKFGLVVWEHGRVDAPGAGNGSRRGFDQPLRLQGQYFDDESDFHYNRQRYYDPSISAFISQDPIGLAGGVNLYAYAPNEIGWIDPFGLVRARGRNFDSEFYRNQYQIITRDAYGPADVYVRGDGEVLPPHPNKHGVSIKDQLDILNNWERSFTGVNENGREVDIYWKSGGVVVTQHGAKNKVITAYGNQPEPQDHERWSNPDRWKTKAGGSYHDEAYCSFKRNYRR